MYQCTSLMDMDSWRGIIIPRSSPFLSSSFLSSHKPPASLYWLAFRLVPHRKVSHGPNQGPKPPPWHHILGDLFLLSWVSLHDAIHHADYLFPLLFTPFVLNILQTTEVIRQIAHSQRSCSRLWLSVNQQQVCPSLFKISPHTHLSLHLLC